MSALAYYFERLGLATVVVALVREHAVSIQPPRALWVPFELGRPFGAPADNPLQIRVLKAAFNLLDEVGPGPILEDYTEEAPYKDGEPGWTFGGDVASDGVQQEANRILTHWEQVRSRSGRTTTGISRLSLLEAVDFIDRYFSENPAPNPKGMARVSRARFAVDDIKAYYLEAAMVGGGHPSSLQLRDWFWETTLAGRMIRAFQDSARNSDDANLKLIASSLVPASRVNSRR